MVRVRVESPTNKSQIRRIYGVFSSGRMSNMSEKFCFSSTKMALESNDAKDYRNVGCCFWMTVIRGRSKCREFLYEEGNFKGQ